MAAPYVTRAIVDRQGTGGKLIVFQGQSYRPTKDLTMCLINRHGGLNLKVASNDLYTDPTSGLAVRVEEHHDFRIVTAWLPQGSALGTGQAAQIKGCLREG